MLFDSMKDKAFHFFFKWSKVTFLLLSKRKYGIFILVSAWCMADLALLSLRPLFLSPRGMPYPALSQLKQPANTAQYMPVWAFNIFHNGSLPPSLSSTKMNKVPQSQIPTLSRLPLQLNGVVIFQNPAYSVASITIKGKNKSGAYRIGEEVEKMAHITKIEKEKVYLINLSVQAEEYIEFAQKPLIPSAIPKDSVKKQASPPQISYIKKTGDFQFELSRSDVNKRLRHLPDILKDATVVPHWENGKLAGWRFEYIKKGSIFNHIGLQESDIITSVAGELPHSQIKAVELFHEIKNSRSKITAKVKRKGKELPFSWSIKEDASKEEPPNSHFY